MSGKGDKRRPQYISDAENALRWQLLSANEREKKHIIEQIEAIRKPIQTEKDKL